VARQWIFILRFAFRYSPTRDAYVLRVLGRSLGPVLRIDRRGRHGQAFEGIDRRRAQTI
jgi:hypothetical protein